MKIIVFTMDDPWFTFQVFETLLSEKITFHRFYFLANPKLSISRVIKLFLVYGKAQFLKFSLMYLYWNIFRNGKVKMMLNKNNIPFEEYYDSDLNNLCEKINQEECDLIVSINCNRLLPDNILSSAKIGAINLHQGSLPEYKGLMPIFYSLLAGEKTVGSSIHLMNNKFDSGEIISIKYLAVNQKEEYTTLWSKLNIIGSKNLAEIIKKIIQDKSLPLAIKKNEGGKYYGIPTFSQIFKYLNR